MGQRLLLAAIMLFILTDGCTRQEGNISGTVIPASADIRVSASRDGAMIASAQTAPDGKFNLRVPAGKYDIEVSVPGSPYPIRFPAVEVAQGKSTDLAPITVAPQAGTSVLSGRVMPVRAGTRVSLYSEGRERAAVITDGEGKYIFTEITAGTYTIEARAPEYAPDSVSVTIDKGGPANRNMAMFYVSPIEGVDWNTGKILVTGIGIPPHNTPNQTVRREMARRSALSDGRRKLIKALSEIKTGPDRTLQSQIGQGYTQKIEGYIRGYRITDEHESSDGRIEIDLELPLTGQDGLSRYLADPH